MTVAGRLDGRKLLSCGKRQSRGPSGVCQPPGASSGVTWDIAQPASREMARSVGEEKGGFNLPGASFLWPRKGNGGEPGLELSAKAGRGL